MLIQFKCANFQSIKEEIVFSTLATKNDTYAERLIGHSANLMLNPVCALYGANGAGKTNLINAMNYLRHLVRENVKLQYKESIPYLPHKMTEPGTPSFFEIYFIDKGIKYVYGVSVNDQRVEEEYLYYFPKGRQAKIFDRIGEEYKYGVSFKKDLSDIVENKMKNNRLFLSTAASWCNIEPILNVFEYIRDKLVVYEGTRNDSWLEYTLKEIEKSTEFKEQFIHLLNFLGIDIEDVEVDNKLLKLLKEDLPSDMPEELKMFLSGKEFKKSNILLKYPQMSIELSEESLGINKLFELAGPIIDILKGGKVLIFDELETSLHPNLVIHIIRLFLNPKINTKGSQLIFTTHDTNLLDLSLFRRDQIWFVEKNKSHSSEFYSLAEVKNVRKDENIEKGYIAGKYGSIPFLNHNLLV